MPPALFEAEGVAEVEFEADVRGGLRRFFYAWGGNVPAEAGPSDKRATDPVLLRVPDPDLLPAWLTDADIDCYVSEFEQSGFRGPLNRYRNNDRDFAFLRDFEGSRIEQPALCIGGERDRVLRMFGERLPLMRGALPDLRGLHLLPGCSHRTQKERPQAVDDHLLTWLRRL
jgi:pimeloyl-ACP methyl ester carboxylesterase